IALSREVFYFVFALFFIVVEWPSGSWAGLEYSQSFPGGEIAVCETCRLGWGKCRRTCIDSEKIAGWCKLNFSAVERRSEPNDQWPLDLASRAEWMVKERTSVASQGHSQRCSGPSH
uniref:Uncharacterized protein n=1 Tax=Mus spicilegus TaxID=10103 RepID=A0A8C6N0X8_MUSSI